MTWQKEHGEKDVIVWKEGQMTHSVVICGLCGHLIVDKVKDPLEIVKMLRRFGIHNMVV